MSSITTQETRNVTVLDQSPYPDGIGKVYLEHVLGETELNGKCNLYAKVTIKPGDALHVHEHVGEAESYYILSGTGLYTDNGKQVTVTPGCVTYTGSGESHGIKNIGEDDLVFMALIVDGYPKQ